MEFDDLKRIATENLRYSELPQGRMNWEKFSSFALTFDPRKENLNPDELAQIGEKVPSANHNIKVLRAFLYNWQRIWNNHTTEPPTSFFVEVSAVIELIRVRMM